MGGYWGYRYAKLKQELYTLDPSAERGWDGAFTNFIVGTLAGNIAAPLFGYNVAKVEMKIDDIKDRLRQNRGVQGNAKVADSVAPAQDLSATRWRDQVTAELPAQAEVAR